MATRRIKKSGSELTSLLDDDGVAFQRTDDWWFRLSSLATYIKGKLSNATASVAGLMSASDKTKLDKYPEPDGTTAYQNKLAVFNSAGTAVEPGANFTTGVADGALSPNDGALTSGRLVAATASGIETKTPSEVKSLLSISENTTTTSEITTSSTLTKNTAEIYYQTTAGITTTLWAGPTTGDYVVVLNASGGDTTLDGDGEVITSATTLTLSAGERAELVYTGSRWRRLNTTSLAMPTYKDASLTTQGVTAGTFYLFGFYKAPAADANLTQASATQVLGSANGSYAAHAFIVAGGAGSVSSGQVGLRVTGASIQDDGTYTGSDSEVLTDNIATLSTDQYLETGKKWLGQVTFELYIVSGAPATYSADFNYGLAKYEDFGNRPARLSDVEVITVAGANDSGFDIIVRKHSTTGWTYSAAAFKPTPPVVVQMSTDHSTARQLINGDTHAYKRAGLAEDFASDSSEGIVVEVVTTTNNAVEILNAHLGVKERV